ncbi:hypothetical protein [Labedaea rhizosphaerae]|uniref:Uncharacterized protein n=1 Tax=Labedaea rhizosphaerae TaxID=598644 RepID=A0A4R6S2E0_LABRH|nr:hypothetical protein [Labedaea rhizosphaerae]TDP92825.1 hypothetical protein EV186_10740 [Labedaea rhizosphaerae]
MDIENLIKDTFTAHEHDAPDGDQVLAATRERIDRKRARLNRPLAVAAGVVLLALAAVTVVALNRPTPGDQVAAAGPARSNHPAVAKAPAKPAIEPLAMPFSLGWLPQGKVDTLARRINTGAAAGSTKPVYDGEYLLNVTVGHQVLLVDVQEMRMMSPDEAMFKSGPGKHVTIGGRAGVESANSGGPGGYELYLTNPRGGSVYVNIGNEPGSTTPATQLIDIGHRVAEHIEFPGTTTVTPVFGLGALPGGMRMCTFEIGRGGPELGTATSTHYSIGTCDTMDTVQVYTSEPGRVQGKPGRQVQGHQTRYNVESGYASLSILDAVDHAAITVAGHLPQADLYKIADHLVLPR